MSARLEDLLDQTRDALVDGKLDALDKLAAEFLALADALPRLDRDEAERIKMKAHRNAVLLQAAQRGFHAARRRVAELRSGPSLSTYDAAGRRAQIAAPSTTAPRRA